MKNWYRRFKIKSLRRQLMEIDHFREEANRREGQLLREISRLESEDMTSKFLMRGYK